MVQYEQQRMPQEGRQEEHWEFVTSQQNGSVTCVH